MIWVLAATSFLGDEGMWRAGDKKQVSNQRAHDLIQEGWVIELNDQGPATQDAAAPELPANEQPITSETGKRKKPKPFDDRETKVDGPAPEEK